MKYYRFWIAGWSAHSGGIKWVYTWRGVDKDIGRESKRIYQKLGFYVIREWSVDYLMEWGYTALLDNAGNEEDGNRKYLLSTESVYALYGI